MCKLSINCSNNVNFQCTQANNPSALLAQSGPVNIVAGQNPLLTTINGSPTVPQGSTISFFTATAPTNSFPVSTITNAVLTTSFPTVATFVSSAVSSISTISVLTTTSTEYSSLVHVTSTGSILLPITDGTPQIPFITPPPLYSIIPFKKWKRVVANQISVPLPAVTITGTRGLPPPTTSQPPATITSPGTTISASGTTITSQPPVQSTFTPPPVTVTLPPSVVTVPPTIVTVTAPPKNVTYGSPVVVVPPPASPFPPPYTSPIIPPKPIPPKTFTTSPSGSIIPIAPAQCAICTSGLINAGHRLTWERGSWVVGFTVVTAFVFVGL